MSYLNIKFLSMKRLLLILITICISVDVYSQWQFAKQIGGTSLDYGGARIDEDDNIYCSGYFTSNCYFNTDTLGSFGANDMFFAKYASNGNELWVKRLGGNNSINTVEVGGVVSIDNLQNCVYFSGLFYGILTIDTFTLISSGGSDIFLAKFDFSGNCLWVKRAGGPSDDMVNNATIDSNGNIYWSGRFDNDGTFGSYNLDKGSFLSKIESNGSIIWARNQVTGGYISQMQ